VCISQKTDPTDDGLALCREARRLRSHQDLLERARLPGRSRSTGKAHATAQHFNARLAESAQPAVAGIQERKNLAEQAFHPATPG
jgi:hypothetical protein